MGYCISTSVVKRCKHNAKVAVFFWKKQTDIVEIADNKLGIFWFTKNEFQFVLICGFLLNVSQNHHN